MAQTIAIERVDHIGIRVRDFDRALGFYRVLGFTLVHLAVRAAYDSLVRGATMYAVGPAFGAISPSAR